MLKKLGRWRGIDDKKLTKRIKRKIVISGEIIEIYDYSIGYKTGYSVSDDVGRKKGAKSKEYDLNRAKVLNRAKKRVMGLINSNTGQYGVNCRPKFLTLTFAENITDLKFANYEFQKFIKRVNYKIFDSKKAVLKYSAVVEFQKRGAIHYHIVLYNLPFTPVKVIRDIWGHGNIKINQIETVDNLGAYVTKYMVKDSSDSRLEGEKCYFNSRGLIEPTVITDENQIETVAQSLSLANLCYSVEYENEYLGQVSYAQYNLNRKNINLSVQGGFFENKNHNDLALLYNKV